MKCVCASFIYFCNSYFYFVGQKLMFEVEYIIKGKFLSLVTLAAYYYIPQVRDAIFNSLYKVFLFKILLYYIALSLSI